MKSVINRMQQPTPRFFITLRNAGLVLAAIAATVLTTPVALPDIILRVAEYLAVAGAVATAVSQTAITNEEQ